MTKPCVWEHETQFQGEQGESRKKTAVWENKTNLAFLVLL